MKKLSLPSISIALLFACHGTAQAGTVTGTIGATIILEKACAMNGTSNATDLNMGSLNFGTHSALFTSANATLTTTSNGAVTVECSNDANGTLTIGNGLHDSNAGTNHHAMKFGTNYVPYDLVTKVKNVLIPHGGTATITGGTGPFGVDITGTAHGKLNLAPGTYTDTISVTLAF